MQRAVRATARPRRGPRLVSANPVERALLRLIAARRARVGIIGLGYVGLPLAGTFAEGGFPVLGFDADREKVSALAAGRSYIRPLPATRVGPLAAPLGALLGPEPTRGRLAATTDLAHLAACDAI